MSKLIPETYELLSYQHVFKNPVIYSYSGGLGGEIRDNELQAIEYPESTTSSDIKKFYQTNITDGARFYYESFSVVITFDINKSTKFSKFFSVMKKLFALFRYTNSYKL